MDFEQILNNPAVNSLLLAVLASSALITFFNDAIAHLVSRIPVVGGLLAMIVRRVTPTFWQWLENQVRPAAERAVLEADVRAPGATGHTRAVLAKSALKEAQPGLTNEQAEREIQAAFNRILADHKRSAKVAGEQKLAA